MGGSPKSLAGSFRFPENHPSWGSPLRKWKSPLSYIPRSQPKWTLIIDPACSPQFLTKRYIVGFTFPLIFLGLFCYAEHSIHTHLSIYLSIHPSSQPSIHLSIYQSINIQYILHTHTHTHIYIIHTYTYIDQQNAHIHAYTYRWHNVTYWHIQRTYTYTRTTLRFRRRAIAETRWGAEPVQVPEPMLKSRDAGQPELHQEKSGVNYVKHGNI